MMFARLRNRLTTHFSERTPVVKRKAYQNVSDIKTKGTEYLNTVSCQFTARIRLERWGWCTLALSLGHHDSCMLKQVEASSRPTGAKRRGAMFHCGAVQTPLSLSHSQRLALSSVDCLPTPSYPLSGRLLTATSMETRM